jgi:hypothetical protein
MITFLCFLALNIITSNSYSVSPSFGSCASRGISNLRHIHNNFISSFYQTPINFKKRIVQSDITNIFCANQYSDDLVLSEADDEEDEEFGDHPAEGNTERHPIYWIDEVEPHRNTRLLAAKNAKNMFKFLRNKSPAPHNVQAFEHAKAEYDRYCRQVAAIRLDITSRHRSARLFTCCRCYLQSHPAWRGAKPAPKPPRVRHSRRSASACRSCSTPAAAPAAAPSAWPSAAQATPRARTACSHRVRRAPAIWAHGAWGRAARHSAARRAFTARLRWPAFELLFQSNPAS